MAFSRAKAKKLARKMFGTTAGDLVTDITFTTSGVWDYDTQTSIENSFDIKDCLVTKASQDDIGGDIQVGDKKILCEFLNGKELRADNTKCVIKGVSHDIVQVDEKFEVIYYVFARAL